MKQTNSDLQQVSPTRNWSNRILAASLFGILFFTLFPYWVDLNATPAGSRSPFLLGGHLHFDGILHTSLNALLFIPFGFALFTLSRRRGRSLLERLAIAFIAGLLLSYAIEFTQNYIPARDSEWDDVIANTLGSVMGMGLGLACGERILRWLIQAEAFLERQLSFRSIVAAGSVYFGVCLAISFPLQRMTRPTDWDPNAFLSIGSDEAGASPLWNGQILRMKIWSKWLGLDQVAASDAKINSETELSNGLLGAYDFPNPPPILNQAGSLPDLVLGRTDAPSARDLNVTDAAVSPWLISRGAVPTLVERVRASHQITFFVECVANKGEGSQGTIVMISPLGGTTDFSIQQQGTNLSIRFLTGLRSEKARIEWLVPNIFSPNVKRSILFTYDGAQGFLYVDGKKERGSYYLSPGAGLVLRLVRIKTNELVAYSVLYDSLVFLPIGFLVGFAARTINLGSRLSTIAVLGIAALFPGLVVEYLLVSISGRHVSVMQVMLTFGLTIAGLLWINLDRPSFAQGS